MVVLVGIFQKAVGVSSQGMGDTFPFISQLFLFRFYSASPILFRSFFDTILNVCFLNHLRKQSYARLTNHWDQV